MFCAPQLRKSFSGKLTISVVAYSKKRLKKNLYRSIILVRHGEFLVFEYLFAKKDRANIESSELASFRKLADVYCQMMGKELDRLLNEGDLVEICNEHKEAI